MRLGIGAELEFEKRLYERGYSLVMSPARMDEGVDFVVYTSRGWVGVQVKTAETIRVTARSKQYEYPHLLLALKRSREYYRQRGVTVFAVWTGLQFYLVPIDEAPATGGTLKRKGHLIEAWDSVLGAPVPAPA